MATTVDASKCGRNTRTGTAHNSFDQSKGEDYQLSHELGLDSYSETNPGSSPNILGDGKVDFMI